MKTIKVALAGAGAFGVKHLDGIKNIPDVEVIALIGRDLAKTQTVADKYGIGFVTDDLAAALIDYCRTRMAGYKRPRRIEFVAELPKTATGKIQRFKLR